MLSAIDRSALVIPQLAPGKPLEQCRKWANPRLRANICQRPPLALSPPLGVGGSSHVWAARRKGKPPPRDDGRAPTRRRPCFRAARLWAGGAPVW